MSQTQYEISEVLEQIGELAPAGYALGFHIAFTTPKFLFQSYPKAWLDHYSQNGLVMTDPIVAWCFENTGYVRWSELFDPANVLDEAAKHGLTYGIVIATDAENSRSMAGLSRNDREFTDAEIETLRAAFESLHKSTADQAQLSAETIQELKNMSILVTHPGS